MKKLFAVLLCLSVLLCPVFSPAEGEDPFTYDTSWLYLTGYDGTDTELVLPSRYTNAETGKTWTLHAVGEAAFQENAALKAVTLEEGYSAVHRHAFEDCAALERVVLPESLLVVDDYAFARAGITEIAFGAGMSFIGELAFKECAGLSTVLFTGEVPHIEPDAFLGCAEELLFLVPEDRTEEYRRELADALYPDAKIRSSGKPCVPYDHTAPESCFEFDASTGTVISYKGYLERVDVPSSIGGVAVTAIGPRAFCHWSYDDGYMYYLKLPEGVREIGSEAVRGLKKLAWVELPSTVEVIGEGAFDGYRGESFRFNEGLREMGRGMLAYSGTNLRRVSIPSTLTAIPDNAFRGSGLTEVKLGSGIRSIGAEAYAQCSGINGRVEIPEGVETIGNRAFSMDMFIREISLPSTLVSVGDGAFDTCSNLERIEFAGDILPQIGTDAFKGVQSLNRTYAVCTVTLNSGASDEAVEEAQRWFDAASLTAQVRRSEAGGTVSASVADTDITFISDSHEYGVAGYHGSLQRIALPVKDSMGNTLKTVADGAFRGNTDLKAVALPNTGTYHAIGDEAFAESGVEELYLAEGVETLGVNALRGCASLRILTLPASLKALGAGALDGCAALEELTVACDPGLLPDGFLRSLPALKKLTVTGCTAIPAGWLEGTGIGEVILSDSVTVIGENAFRGSALSRIGLSSVKRIGDGAFTETSLTSAELTAAEEIGSGAFADCEGLSSVVLGNMLNRIGSNAFRGASIGEITVPASVTSVGEGAFENCARLASVTLSAPAVLGDRAFAGTAIEAFVLPAGMKLNTSAFPETALAELRAAADATDAELAELNELLGRPWHRPVLREGEADRFIAMSEPATDEAQFSVSADGTLEGYLGSETDIVIPVSVGGVTVRAISAHAFDRARDYAGTEVVSDKVPEVKPISLVIPETVETVADQAFAYCQSLETVICYAPLASSGKAAFLQCTSLKNVSYVNGVLVLDNYLFDGCTALETVDYGTLTEKIGTDVFSGCGMREIRLDAKEIAGEAVVRCGALERVTLSARIERAEAGMIRECPLVSGLVFEGNDASFLPQDGILNGVSARVECYVPADTDAENEKKFGSVYMWSMDPHEADVIRGEAPELAESTVTPALTEATASPEMPDRTAAPAVTEIPVSGNTPAEIGAYEGTWYCVYLGTGYASGDPRAMYGLAITLTLNADGNAVLDYAGPEEGMWREDEEGIVRYSDGTPLSFLSDGNLLYGTAMSGYMVFSRDPEGTASVLPGQEIPSATEAPSVTEAPQTTPAAAPAPEGDFIGKKFAAVTFVTNGVSMDASVMGSYSITFNADGTADFVMAGMPLPTLTWQAEGDTVTVDYFGTPFSFRVTEAGLEMDYFGSGTMIMTE